MSTNLSPFVNGILTILIEGVQMTRAANTPRNEQGIRLIQLPNNQTVIKCFGAIVTKTYQIQDILSFHTSKLQHGLFSITFKNNETVLMKDCIPEIVNRFIDAIAKIKPTTTPNKNQKIEENTMITSRPKLTFQTNQIPQELLTAKNNNPKFKKKIPPITPLTDIIPTTATQIKNTTTPTQNPKLTRNAIYARQLAAAQITKRPRIQELSFIQMQRLKQQTKGIGNAAKQASIALENIIQKQDPKPVLGPVSEPVLDLVLESTFNLGELSDDLLWCILEFVPGESLVVCRKWYDLVSSRRRIFSVREHRRGAFDADSIVTKYLPRWRFVRYVDFSNLPELTSKSLEDFTKLPRIPKYIHTLSLKNLKLVSDAAVSLLLSRLNLIESIDLRDTNVSSLALQGLAKRVNKIKAFAAGKTPTPNSRTQLLTKPNSELNPLTHSNITKLHRIADLNPLLSSLSTEQDDIEEEEEENQTAVPMDVRKSSTIQLQEEKRILHHTLTKIKTWQQQQQEPKCINEEIKKIINPNHNKSSTLPNLPGVCLEILLLPRCTNIPETELCRVLYTSGSNLRVIDLSDSLSVASKTLYFLARFCPNLTALNLSGCLNIASSINNYFVHHAPKNLKCIDLSRISTLENNFPNALKHLAKRCTNLKAVSFARSNVSTDTVSEFLKNCPQLEIIDVSSCPDVDATAFSFATNPETLKHLIAVNSTQITHWELVKNTLPICKQLTIHWNKAPDIWPWNTQRIRDTTQPNLIFYTQQEKEHYNVYFN